jgi:hypothetical protein
MIKLMNIEDDIHLFLRLQTIVNTSYGSYDVALKTESIKFRNVGEE